MTLSQSHYAVMEATRKPGKELPKNEGTLRDSSVLTQIVSQHEFYGL